MFGCQRFELDYLAAGPPGASKIVGGVMNRFVAAAAIVAIGVSATTSAFFVEQRIYGQPRMNPQP